MSSISQIFRLTDTPKFKDGSVVQLSKPNTPIDKRASRKSLEDAYIKDEIVNNGTNTAVSIMTSAKFGIVGSDKSVSVINEFLDGVGNNGGNDEWFCLLELILRYQLIYGPSYNELIYDTKKEHIMDLQSIDPKTMDYAKDNTGKIVFDRFGKPIGFTQELPLTSSAGFGSVKKPPSPKGVDTLNKIFFTSDRIVQYKLNEVGTGFYPIGWVEPIVKISEWKRIMYEALANVYYHTAFPIKYWQVGDNAHEPTSDLLRKTSDKLKNANYRSSFAIPHYVKPGILEASNTDKLKEHLRQFIDSEVTMMGPSAFVTGSGEKANKSVLARQEFLYKMKLRDILDRTGKTIEQQIFARIAKLENLKDVPKVTWGKLNLEELDAKSGRIAAYTKQGLITPNKETENFIRDYEGLPVNEDVKRSVEK